jgi:hypothetical protein
MGQLAALRAGKQGHLFDQGSRAVERAPASPVLPPPRPTSLARLCQRNFPYVVGGPYNSNPPHP